MLRIKRITSSVRLFVAAGFLGLMAIGFSGMVDDSQAAQKSRSKSKRTSSRTSKKKDVTFTTGSSDAIIEFVNAQIRQAWEDNEVSPSEIAEDAEWLRRVYLDIVGAIPSGEDVAKFLSDKDKAKRSKVIDKLLDDPGYIRNWTTIWTNLTIGQQTPRRVSRAGMSKFFREAFGRNRPWNDVVFDLVSAEGHFEQNGAVNYLLAQMTMRDEGVQATAKTTRLFMGIQVQCTQCHNHPFNDWKQSQFWQFNSFFRQARRIDHRKLDPETGRMVDDYSELVFEEFGGPITYEKRSGVIFAAIPKYIDEKVSITDSKVNDPSFNRRKDLAESMTAGERPYIALAMVNRVWGHFFGYGFTKPIDDMGPHNPSSHPELLDYLAKEFVKSRYDVKQLIRWVTNSEAYNLTSKVGRKNEIDNPAAGETALFSHMYVKSMTAEQLYDSLIIATNAHKSGRSNWEQAERQRQQWLQQFVLAFGTDEGDEATTFNGTIPQALMMMNGQLIQNATNAEKGSYLREVLAAPGNDNSRIKQLYLSTLGRMPSRRESSAATKLIRGSRDQLASYQDLYWALLNSNEFIFNH